MAVVGLYADTSDGNNDRHRLLHSALERACRKLSKNFRSLVIYQHNADQENGTLGSLVYYLLSHVQCRPLQNRRDNQEPPCNIISELLGLHSQHSPRKSWVLDSWELPIHLLSSEYREVSLRPQ